ncbi:MAG: hypothetical protein HZT43_01695 [Exiguobacterium profundum]|nr:MAG: hypothetical protein HZT43_01695 [Exiguobacterium profundum]
MSGRFLILLVALLLADSTSAQELGVFQTLYDERSVQTRDLTISVEPVDDDVSFSVTLINKENDFERMHEFDGQGANDPSPFQLGYMNYCDTMTILLTVEYPWRHALPSHSRVLETFAFRETDFAFIDVAFGPLTDIALIDSSHPEAADTAMQPPILVECISDEGGIPFRFQLKTNN